MGTKNNPKNRVKAAEKRNSTAKRSNQLTTTEFTLDTENTWLLNMLELLSLQ